MKVENKTIWWGVLHFALHTKYYLGDRINDDEMYRACSTHYR